MEEEAFVLKSSPTRLFNHRLTFRLDDTNDFTWPQYFALFALLCIDKAEYIERSSKGGSYPKDFKKNIPGTVVFYAMEAMESVCYAEFLLREIPTDDEVEHKVKQSISIRNSKAAIQRHAHTNRLKLQFIEYYRSGKFPSKAEAARRFYKSLTNKPDNPTAETAERFFTSALRDFEKTQKQE